MATHTAGMDSFEFRRLLKAEQTMTSVRTVAVAFALVQVLTFYKPYPEGMLALALAAVAALLSGNLVLKILLRQTLTAQRLRRISFASMMLDLLVAITLTFVYAFDVETAIWAVIYILPLGGAIRFQRKGAIGITAAATVLYTGRDAFAAAQYNIEFLPTSISFRMGIAFVIAWVAGTVTNNLLRGHHELEAVNEELRSVNHAMHDFVSVASHDMRTPLSVIGGLSKHLDEHSHELAPEQSQELIAAIRRNAQSLERLVNDLLTTSNIEAGTINSQLEMVDLASATKDAIAASGVPSNLVQVEIPSGLQAWVDAAHLQRMLVNLITNANKYGAPPIAISASSSEDDVKVRVSDNGPGVNPEFEPRLYERFARSSTNDSSTDGSGLGLAIVKGLAQLNGGDIFYEREHAKGATFCLQLPARPHVENEQ